MQFKFNPISEPKDVIPENSLEAKPPMSFDYSYATIDFDDNENYRIKWSLV